MPLGDPRGMMFFAERRTLNAGRYFPIRLSVLQDL